MGIVTGLSMVDLAVECKIPPPYRAIPFRDSFTEGVSHPGSLTFMGHRARIAEIPLLHGGIAPQVRVLEGGVRTQSLQIETPKTPSCVTWGNR